MEVWLVIALIVLAYLAGLANAATTRNIKYVPVERDELNEKYTQAGYYQARTKLPATGMTIEDLNLAIHRTEGILGAVNDNMHELKQEAKKLNGSTTDSARE